MSSSGRFLTYLEGFLKIVLLGDYLWEFLNQTNIVSIISRIVRNIKKNLKIEQFTICSVFLTILDEFELLSSSGAFLKQLEAFLEIAQETNYLKEFLNQTNMVSIMLRIVIHVVGFCFHHPVISCFLRINEI